MFGTYYYHQTIRKMVITFGTLFNDITIKRVNTSGETIETIKVPIAYGPKQKFLTRTITDPKLKRPAIILPRIGFVMSTVVYDGSRKLNTIGKNWSSVSGTLRTQYNPVPYNFIIDLSILAKNAEDGTQILEQILPNFTPEFTATIKTVPLMEISNDVPIILNSVGYSDNYDGDFISRRAISWDLSFTMKGYVYPEISTTGKLIKTANVEISVSKTSGLPGNTDRITMEDSTPFTVNSMLNESSGKIVLESSDTSGPITETIQLQTTPANAEPDDFGFSVSIDGDDVGWN